MFVHAFGKVQVRNSLDATLEFRCLFHGFCPRRYTCPAGGVCELPGPAKSTNTAFDIYQNTNRRLRYMLPAIIKVAEYVFKSYALPLYGYVHRESSKHAPTATTARDFGTCFSKFASCWTFDVSLETAPRGRRCYFV